MSRAYSVPRKRTSLHSLKSIGNYSLGKTLGEGTFGKVRLGTHTLTGQLVAVKVLEKDRLKEQADVERVSREMRILKKIRHPNIIQLYEIIETPHELFLIMEYASGGEVFDYIVARSRLKEPVACKFLQQVWSAVEYLHRLNIVHRDLKPENLLLDKDGNLKIADFGLSNCYRPGDLLKTACGSPCYAAPEMVAGSRYVPSRVDVWSSGVVMFAMVCGYLPFEDPNTAVLYKKIMSGDYKCPSFLSLEAKDLLKRILHTNPDLRYDIPLIKQHSWYKKVQQPLDTGTLAYESVPINEAVLQSLREYGLDPEGARLQIKENKHNHLTTTYYLLLKKAGKPQPCPPPQPPAEPLKANPRTRMLMNAVKAEGEPERKRPTRQSYANSVSPHLRERSVFKNSGRVVIPREPSAPKPPTHHACKC